MENKIGFERATIVFRLSRRDRNLENLEASWASPYNMNGVNVLGPKGKLLSRHDDLLLRAGYRQSPETTPEGERVKLNPVPREKSNPIAYFLDCIGYSTTGGGSPFQQAQCASYGDSECHP
jgi:hypothetical protein